MPRLFEMVFHLATLVRTQDLQGQPACRARLNASLQFEGASDWSGEVDVRLPSSEVSGTDDISSDYLREHVFPRMARAYALMACRAAMDLELEHLGGPDAPQFVAMRYRNSLVGNNGLDHQDKMGRLIWLEPL